MILITIKIYLNKKKITTEKNTMMQQNQQQ